MKQALGQRPGAFHCCRVRVDAYTLDGAADELLASPSAPHGRAVHLCSAYTLSLARRHPMFQELINRGDLNLPDGMPLVWAGRRLGFEHMDGRVYGPDLMATTLDRGRYLGLRHYLYGSTPQVVDALSDHLQRRFPSVEIVGCESPPFRDLVEKEVNEMVDRVRSAAPHLVWVGLGTPRQDLFVDQFRDRLDATLVAVGAAFDFLAGARRQAPRWMQRNGLEWAYRLASEPRRLWKRYLIGNALFVDGVLRDGLEVVDEPGTGPLQR